jgi:predicted PP-loop superfamily ATPase
VEESVEESDEESDEEIVSSTIHLCYECNLLVKKNVMRLARRYHLNC